MTYAIWGYDLFPFLCYGLSVRLEEGKEGEQPLTDCVLPSFVLPKKGEERSAKEGET